MSANSTPVPAQHLDAPEPYAMLRKRSDWPLTCPFTETEAQQLRALLAERDALVVVKCPNCYMPATGPGLAFPDGTICNEPSHAGSTRAAAPPEDDTNGR